MAAVDCGEVAGGCGVAARRLKVDCGGCGVLTSGYTGRLWGMAAGRLHGGCGVAAGLLRVSVGSCK